MKLIEFKEYNNLENNVLNKRKVVIAAVLAIAIFVVVLYSILYAFSPKFRRWADIHILMKCVQQGNLPSVDIDADDSTYFIGYDKYIAVLNNYHFMIYNSSAKEIANLDVKVSNPISKSNGKYLVLAENQKEKIYVISGTRILWSKDIEGAISRVDINENGYVSVVCSGTTYKSVVVTFDQAGNELFKTYIPSNKVVDSVISSDNKYLSIAEVDTSGTLVKSIVKTISIKDAKASPDKSVANTYEMPTNVLVIYLKYQGSKNLICMCDDGIRVLSDGKIEKLFDFQEEGKNYSFAGIDLINNIYEVEESATGISSQVTKINMLNTGNKKRHVYSVDSIAKDTLSAGDIIAVNLGTEVYFVDTRGWLKKKYQANEEIRDVVLSERIAAIVYRDHIEILVL